MGRPGGIDWRVLRVWRSLPGGSVESALLEVEGARIVPYLPRGRSLRVSPDGAQVAFYQLVGGAPWDEELGLADVYVGPIDGPAEVIFHGVTGNSPIAWDARGGLEVTGDPDGHGWRRYRWDGALTELPPEPVVPNLGRMAWGDSPDGRYGAWSKHTSTWELWRTEPATGAEVRVSADHAYWGTWLADGRLAFSEKSWGVQRIAIHDPRNGSRRVLSDRKGDTHPIAHPTLPLLAASSTPAPFEAVVIDADSGERQAFPDWQVEAWFAPARLR